MKLYKQLNPKKKIMNKVIEQLKNQATEDILGVKQVDAELFAELIIRECAKFSDVQEDLFAYFGVKE